MHAYMYVCVCACVCIYVCMYVCGGGGAPIICVCIYLCEPAEEEAHPSLAADLVPQAVVDIACPREVLCPRERERERELLKFVTRAHT
jgi:hypothetical protein